MLLALFCACTAWFVSDMFGNHIVGFPTRRLKCREEIASALNDFGNRWSEREGVDDNALKEWKGSISTIVDKRIKFYSQNTNLLPPKPKSSFRHLKQGIQEFHRKYVLVPADKQCCCRL